MLQFSSVWLPYMFLAVGMAGGTATLLLWRRQRSAARALAESERARQKALAEIAGERRSLDMKAARALEARDAAEARFRGAFDQAAVGMNHVLPNGRYLRVNERYCEITGYTREELLGITIDAITHPDDLAADRVHIQKLLCGERSTATWQKRYIRKDGSVIWVDLTGSVVRPNSGEPLYLLGVVQDVTARVTAEKALRQSEERFRQLVENAPYGIVVETGLQFLYLNPAAARMLGAESPEQLVGSSMLDRMHPDERAAVRERSRAVGSGASVMLLRRTMLRLDGNSFPASISATPIVYDGQQAALVFLHDISAEHQAEEERSRLEQRLRHAQKMESVGRLAGGVAHDFNNHLTVINGYCDMLLEELASDDPLRDEIGEIRAAGQRAAALTEQLLTFSRKQVVELRPISLNGVVEEHCRMVRRLIGDDIEVVTDLEPQLGAVMADRGQMQQVLMNLAVNARDAMPRGGKLIIGTGNAEIGPGAEGASHDIKPGAYVVLTVSDTGTGMTPEILSKIFEPFFTTKSAGAGTGLGLATVYGIVEQGGGFLRVSSEPGHGATFRIYLPRTAQRVEDAAATGGRRKAPRGCETVLVVEDQEDVRRLAVSILRKNGYRVLEAGSGAEAVGVAAKYAETIDLLITDLVMPGMTGRELAAKLQASRAAIKVLYMSGYTNDGVAPQSVIDPGMPYLAKPFTPADLASKVREALGVADARRRILVIDDDQAVRDCVCETLARAGFDVLPAPDGDAGLRMVEAHKVHLVITDLVMPEREGLETVKLLRQRYPEVHVIAMSGAFEGEFLKAAARMGAQATFLKPVDTGRLLTAVRQLMA